MPSSTINRGDDHDSIFYLFAARGSLRYGELMEEEGRRTDDPASADALFRHAIDYMRAAINVCELFDNTYHATDDSKSFFDGGDADMLKYLEEFRSIGLMAYAAIQRCHAERSSIGNRIMALGKPYYQFNEESNVKYTALLSKTQNASFRA
jgi:hypothetical protein